MIIFAISCCKQCLRNNFRSSVENDYRVFDNVDVAILKGAASRVFNVSTSFCKVKQVYFEKVLRLNSSLSFKVALHIFGYF